MSTYTTDHLRSIFQQPFNRETWKAVLLHLFHADKLRTTPEQISSENDNEVGYYMGSIDTADAFRIGLFYYHIEQGSVAHKKVGLRNLVKRFVNQKWGEFDAAIVVFDDKKEWRLSFVCDIKEEATAPKRFTFVFGESDNTYHTPVERFVALQKSQPTFENIRKAFSVEALNDDFFEQYRELYADFVQYITGKRYVKEGSKWVERKLATPNNQHKTTFGENDKLVRDYIKKMFGRIVFLYFLQRKGWLDGNRQYMRNLFANATAEQKDNFLDGVLEPLFFEVLNTDKPNRTEKAQSLPGIDNIPYLNGGLFARDEIDDRTCVFPEKLFKQLFGFLDSYNFTIDENDINDAEIGVDPEMLGRIFENLLEDNKDKGAFYTPKEIVDYMCRESIIAYLQNEQFSQEGNDKIRAFVESYDGESLSKEQRTYLRDKLKAVKICDPAIGSGAFPMGMVNLLSKLYVVLKINTDFAVVKRHIMEQNIYGVDIEKGAVDIARLRFWLAMIVEEPEPIPLPNLHFKIMQGNSLLEYYQGVDLSTLLGKSNGEFQYDYADPEFQQTLENSLAEYYKTSSHCEREKLTSRIDDLILSRFIKRNSNLVLDGVKPSENDKFFMWHTWFSDVFKNGGFDVVIGNPPYGAKLSDSEKVLLKTLYHTTKTIKGIQKGSMDTYTMFIELSYKLLKKNGAFAMIVPISLTSSDSLSGVHRILNLRCDDVRISSYAVRPQPVFKNAVVNTSILLFRKTGEKCNSLKATKMYRKGRIFNLQHLIDNLEYVDVRNYTMFGRIPKISLPIEISILRKIRAFDPLYCWKQSSGVPIYYRFAGGRYYKVVTNYSTGSSAERAILLDRRMANSIGCILSSSLSFWYYQIYSDNLNWKSVEIESLPIPKLNTEQVNYLEMLYENYLKDIETNANIRTSSGNSQYNVDKFREYKIGRSKHIIDKIDDYIGHIFGFSQEEIDFIKNYEIEFRLSEEDE